MRVRIAVLALLVVTSACGDSSNPGDAPDDQTPKDDEPACPSLPKEPADAYCDGATTWLWDPPSKSLLAFPDDYFTLDDTSTQTGLKVDVRPDQNVTVPTSVARFKNVYSELSRLDGFSVNGAAYVRFSGALNRAALPAGGIGSGKEDAPVMLVRLDDDKVTFLDFTVEAVSESATDDSTTLLVKPLVPLIPGARHALVVTTALQDAANGCIAPSPTWLSILSGEATEPGLVRLGARYEALVERLQDACAISSAHDISAAVLFTTQTTVDVSVATRDDINKKSIPYTKTDCTPEATFTHCEGTLQVGDYRKNKKYIEPGAPQATNSSLPVSIWMPNTRGPHPVILVGHGLGGGRADIGSSGFATSVTTLGWAVIAVDAPKHGDHYDQPAIAQVGGLEIFGVDGMALYMGGTFLDTRRLTDNLRQAAYDKLQVVRALVEGIDADEDGTIDLNTDTLAYAGVSLGGIMAPELLALSDEFDLAISLVPGARLGDIIADSDAFAQGRDQMLGSASNVEKKRLFAVLQASVDRADPGSWGSHVLGERLPGSEALKPQFLMQMVINDEVVPNSANAYYARALGLPLVGDELLGIHVPRIASLPTSANLEAGLTGGVYQLDIDGGGRAYTHGTGPLSAVSSAQIVPFITSFQDRGVSEIVDSYRTTGAKR